MGIVINPDDTIEIVHPYNNLNYSLEQIKHYIGGGYIEVVPLGDSYYMVVDEDGIGKGLPINDIASAMYLATGGNSRIHGSVLICERGEIE